MQFKLIVFDLAGTTVKDRKDVHRVLQTAMKVHGVDITIEEANAVMGIPKPEAIRQLLEKKKNGDIHAGRIHAIHQTFVESMIHFYETDESVGEKYGVSSTFESLKKKGFKIAVDTGFDRFVTNPLLKRLGWLTNDLIDFSITSDEVPNGRPAPDMIFEVMRRADISDSKMVIKVGDTASDIQQGHAAGCGMIVGVTTGAFSKTDLEKENPHHLIEQIPAILELIG